MIFLASNSIAIEDEWDPEVVVDKSSKFQWTSS